MLQNLRLQQDTILCYKNLRGQQDAILCYKNLRFDISSYIKSLASIPFASLASFALKLIPFASLALTKLPKITLTIHSSLSEEDKQRRTLCVRLF